jgi:hypothetical protein
LSLKAADHRGAPLGELAVRLASKQAAFTAALAKVAAEVPEESPKASEEAPKSQEEASKQAALRFRLAKSLARLEAVSGRIDELEGRPRFNAVRARVDAGRLASRIASVVTSQAAKEDSVAELVASTDRLYGLFFPEG